MEVDNDELLPPGHNDDDDAAYVVVEPMLLPPTHDEEMRMEFIISPTTASSSSPPTSAELDSATRFLLANLPRYVRESASITPKAILAELLDASPHLSQVPKQVLKRLATQLLTRAMAGRLADPLVIRFVTTHLINKHLAMDAARALGILDPVHSPLCKPSGGQALDRAEHLLARLVHHPTKELALQIKPLLPCVVPLDFATSPPKDVADQLPSIIAQLRVLRAELKLFTNMDNDDEEEEMEILVAKLLPPHLVTLQRCEDSLLDQLGDVLGSRRVSAAITVSRARAEMVYGNHGTKMGWVGMNAAQAVDALVNGCGSREPLVVYGSWQRASVDGPLLFLVQVALLGHGAVTVVMDDDVEEAAASVCGVAMLRSRAILMCKEESAVCVRVVVVI